MLNAAVSFFLYLFELLVAYIVFSSLGERRHVGIATALIGLAIFECGAVINVSGANSIWLNSIYTVSSTFLFAVVCFKIKTVAAVAYTVVMAIFSSSLEFATIFAVSAIAGADIKAYNSDISLLILEIAVSKGLYFIFCVILSRVSGDRKTAYRVPVEFSLLPGCILLSLLAFWYISAHEKLSYVNQMLLAIVSAALLCATVFLFIAYRDNIERENEYVQVRSENDRLQLEKEYYDIIEHRDKQLMLYAHDTKNHLAAIQRLSTEPRVNAYIDELLGRLGSYTDSCRSGNKMLDVMIDRYSAKCEASGIEFNCDVKNCNLNTVEDIDLVSILGNIMDNALSAAAESAEKYISLETGLKNSYSVIMITNSCDKAPRCKGRRLISTKEDRRIHGFGLKSVESTLEKYQGDFKWHYDPGPARFTATAILYTRPLPPPAGERP